MAGLRAEQSERNVRGWVVRSGLGPHCREPSSREEAWNVGRDGKWEVKRNGWKSIRRGLSEWNGAWAGLSEWKCDALCWTVTACRLGTGLGWYRSGLSVEPRGEESSNGRSLTCSARRLAQRKCLMANHYRTDQHRSGKHHAKSRIRHCGRSR